MSDNDNFNGIEYYSGGIFEIGRRTSNQTRQTSNYVESFDWRNRHGKNWMTSVKDQQSKPYCLAFGELSCIEAMVNLYFNNKIDLDLSEQELVSCSKVQNCSHGLDFTATINYLKNHGICDEASYPYQPHGFFCNDTLQCLSEEITPIENVRISDLVYTGFTYGDIKQALIQKGPLLSGWSATQGRAGHAMALVGYGTIKANDTIYSYNPTTNLIEAIGYINEEHQLIGSTYWIFKNSYGHGPTNTTNYYMNLIFNDLQGNGDSAIAYSLWYPSYVKLPIYRYNHTNEEIVCEDADGDGFFFWGLGNSKPSSCPAWAPSQPDGDDNDDSKGPFKDVYGHLWELDSIPTETPWIINYYTECGYHNTINRDIRIVTGGKMVLKAYLIPFSNVTIYIEDNGELCIDGGHLKGINIEMSGRSKLSIIHGGVIDLKRNATLTAPLSATLIIEDGQINSYNNN